MRNRIPPIMTNGKILNQIYHFKRIAKPESVNNPARAYHDICFVLLLRATYVSKVFMKSMHCCCIELVILHLSIRRSRFFQVDSSR